MAAGSLTFARKIIAAMTHSGQRTSRADSASASLPISSSPKTPVTALAVPIASDDAVKAGADSPLERTENALHPWVTYLILPSFAFLNAGVSLEGITPGALLAPVPLGIAAGLVVGKAVGVGAVVWAMVRFGGARLPAGATRLQFFGVAILCGVGFTMSLFIGSLAFTGADPVYWTQVKIGVLAGSLASGLAGFLVLRLAGKPRRPRQAS